MPEDWENEPYRKIDDFIGDDNINWSEHAYSEATKVGWWANANKLAFDYFNYLITDNANCMELGCNIGRWAPIFVLNHWNYVGIDASKTAIDIAMKHYYPFPVRRNLECTNHIIDCSNQDHDHSINFVQGNILDLKTIFPLPKQFDLIFTNTVLQHLHNDHKTIVLKSVHGLLRGHGILVIQESIHPSERTFTREGWIAFVEKTGFKLVTMTPPENHANGFVFIKI